MKLPPDLAPHIITCSGGGARELLLAPPSSLGSSINLGSATTALGVLLDICTKQMKLCRDSVFKYILSWFYLYHFIDIIFINLFS